MTANMIPCGLCALVLFPSMAAAQPAPRRDIHSYATPEHVRVTHVDLDLEVQFERRAIAGQATLTVERVGDADEPLVLDVKRLEIGKVQSSPDGRTFRDAPATVGTSHAIFGAPLHVELGPGDRFVRIEYETHPEASAVQWLEPAQTAGKRDPFLFTQSQAIHARSWIPIQDSPAVRVTYAARIRTPRHLLAVMSAANDPMAERDGDYTFEMRQPIPAYLIALAVGDLTYRPVGRRTGVYAEPALADAAAAEFADMERMLESVEAIYGPYRWEQYDVLVLPPSFPFGGMENPRLTFATPTILAGDKSLVSLIAHEMAHSWSGNLVSNATWSDFWLNEGFTVYLERRIVESIYGPRRAAMESALGRQALDDALATLETGDQILHVDLAGRDPDDGMTEVPYEKGALLLTMLERHFGREAFDAFLKSYFEHFAFQSITTVDFARYLDEHLLRGDRRLAEQLRLRAWLYEPGIPASAPGASADAFAGVEAEAQAWLDGRRTVAGLAAADWSTQEWLRFLDRVADPIDRDRMAALDGQFQFTDHRNSEILFKWLKLAIQHEYEPAYPRLDSFLTSVGRRKFLQPLYQELMKTDAGSRRAREIYRRARPAYHPIASSTIDGIVGWDGQD